jgi:osomolarity two-component system, sensor histidine kinase SLN1
VFSGKKHGSISFCKPRRQNTEVLHARETKDMTSEPSQSKRLSVIVADANSTDAMLLQIYLRTHCSHVATVHSGQASVDAVVDSVRHDSPFDAVILNIRVHGIDGIEATKLMREAGYTRPIIGTSSEFTTQHKQQWTAAGCNAFVEKPIRLDTLMEVLLASVAGP